MVLQMAKGTAASKLTPTMVAEKIHAIISGKKKPLRVPMDRAVPLSIIKRLAPQALIDRMVRGLVQGVEGLKPR